MCKLAIFKISISDASCASASTRRDGNPLRMSQVALYCMQHSTPAEEATWCYKSDAGRSSKTRREYVSREEEAMMEMKDALERDGKRLKCLDCQE